MHYLMQNETIANKVKAAGKEGKQYAIYTIEDSGNVILGETKSKFWNQLIGCKFTLTFESFATCVWDALVDLATGDNQEALLKGLSKEVLEKAQREKKYDWVVERLVTCFRHVCNNKDTESRPEGRSGKSDQKIGGNQYIIRDANGTPVQINVNVGNNRRTFRFPDATGQADLVLEMGVVGVTCEQH
jgi:hypothetical protein